MFMSMWIHTILLNFGIDLPFAQPIMGCALLPSIWILSFSNVFNFCYIHKTMTIYSLIVDLCINIERYIGFGEWLDDLRMIVSLMGFGIFMLLLIHFNDFSEKCIKFTENSMKDINDISNEINR